ncbi:MAG: glycosyltransferase [Alphaproteobacteria bacterium]|nr:glycosyltransferase [Alphaproteobacteria bacterium]
MLASLVTGHSEPGIEQFVASLVPNGALVPRLRAAGVAVREFNFRSPAAPLEVVRLSALIRKASPSVVQGWMYHGNLAASAALAFSGRRARTALVWGLRCSDMDLSQYSAQLRIVVRAGACLSAGPDVVTANSDAGLAWHLKLGYKPRRTLVVPNGINIDRFRPDERTRASARRLLGLAPDAFVLAHVARLDPMKDHHTFLAALRTVPNVHGLLIGAGTERLPAQARVQRLGHRDDIPELLVASDTIVSSSAYGEGFCTALAEGMACGLPALATDVGDARKILGETGYVVPPRDPRALADAIGKLLGEARDLRAIRGRAARERVVTQFSLAAAERRFADLYRDLAPQ